MSSLFEVIVLFGSILAILVIWAIWQMTHVGKMETWPETEGTIHSVGKAVVDAGQSNYTIDVGNFSYRVNDEYYSGRLRIVPSSSLGEDRSLRELVNHKIKVSYDPQKPEKFSISQSELGGFFLTPHYDFLGENIDPIVLNIN